MPTYFAYGSNMDSRQMKERCPNAKFLGIGFLPDYKIGFTHYSTRRDSPVADIISSKGEMVWGVIYELTDEDLFGLDRHEGNPYVYCRKIETIHKISELQKSNYDELLMSKEFTPIQAEVYEVVSKKINAKPATSYLSLLIRGAAEHKLPISYQDKLNELESNAYKRKITKITNRYKELEFIISKGFFPTEIQYQTEWAGANLVITGDQSRKDELNIHYPHDLVVLTPHWREVSWLINTLYVDERIGLEINSINKHYVLNQFGETALAYQHKYPNDKSPIGICLAIAYNAVNMSLTAHTSESEFLI